MTDGSDQRLYSGRREDEVLRRVGEIITLESCIIFSMGIKKERAGARSLIL